MEVEDKPDYIGHYLIFQILFDRYEFHWYGLQWWEISHNNSLL